MPDEENENKCLLVLKFLGFYWRGVFSIIWPPLCLVVFLLGTEEKFRCIFVVLWMAGYWVTECIPLYATGLMPVVLMPMLSIQDTGAVCINYFNETNMMFLASLFVAITIEHCGLHNRIAMGTILRVGCSPRRLHFGLTFVTMFMSMWLANSAATAMMCPIIKAVLNELHSQNIIQMYYPKEPDDPEEKPPRPTNISMCYFFAAAYASTIGGIGCIVGTGTNLTYKGLYETRFPDGNKIEFVTWLLINVPHMLLMTIGTWLSLQVQFMGLFRPSTEEYTIVKQGAANAHLAYAVVEQKMKDLGPMTWHESGVALFFLLCVGLWITRRPEFVPGWGNLYHTTKVKDASPAFLVILLMVAIPASLAFVYFCSADKTKRPKKVSPGLITWKYLQEKMPWGLLFLLGGGFALADAGKKSGMSTYLGNKLIVMSNLPWIVIMGITSLLSSLATELTANVAICNIIIPVLIEMSVAMKIHPILFSMPAAVSCSLAFMMPVGTPPNAIVAGEGNLETSQMIKAGLMPKFVGWLVIMALFPTYGQLFFDFSTTPDWVLGTSGTANATDASAH